MKALNSIGDVNRAVGEVSCKLVVIRFGDQDDPLCMHTDALLEKVSPILSNYVEIYTCERTCVRELVDVMDLDSSLNIMCFFNQRHIKIDCSSGDTSKINFLIEDEEVFIELFTLAYKAGIRNKGVVNSPFKFGRLEGM